MTNTEVNKVITVKGLKKSFGKNKVLKDVSFDVERGSMLALLGPNGAGKTTIVRILATLLKADAGKATVEGFDVGSSGDKVRSVIGLTGQSASIDELLTGRENLIMMGRLYRLTKKSATQRAAELLKDFDLLDAADRPAKTYSGGMRRRLDLAVSLIAQPPVIFLDEPTTGLDPRSRLVMWDIINDLMKQGTTILLTTQYLEEADQLADNIIVIDGGRVIAEGAAAELKAKIGDDRLVLLFGSSEDWKIAKKELGKKVVDADEGSKKLVVGLKNKNKDIRDALASIDKHKITLDSIDIHKPTLDDVFLSVTKGRDK